MDILHTIQDGTLTVQPKDRIDTTTAPEFQAAVLELLPGVSAVDIDLAGVDYISSAGLRALLFLQKRCRADGIAMRVLNVAPAILDVFSKTGFDKVLKIG